MPRECYFHGSCVWVHVHNSWCNILQKPEALVQRPTFAIICNKMKKKKHIRKTQAGEKGGVEMHNGEAEILDGQNQQQINKEAGLQTLIEKALKSYPNLHSIIRSKKGKKGERKSSRRRNNGRKCINKVTENKERDLGNPLTSPPPAAGCSTPVDTKGRKKSPTSVSALLVQSFSTSTEPYVSELNKALEVGTNSKTSENEKILEERSQSTGTNCEENGVILKRNTYLKVGSSEKEETRDMPVSENYALLEQRFKTMKKNVLKVFHYIVPDFSLGEEQDIENILSTMNQIISAQEEKVQH